MTSARGGGTGETPSSSAAGTDPLAALFADFTAGASSVRTTRCSRACCRTATAVSGPADADADADPDLAPAAPPSTSTPPRRTSAASPRPTCAPARARRPADPRIAARGGGTVLLDDDAGDEPGCAGLNDMRLALGTALDVGPDTDREYLPARPDVRPRPAPLPVLLARGAAGDAARRDHRRSDADRAGDRVVASNACCSCPRTSTTASSPTPAGTTRTRPAASSPAATAGPSASSRWSTRRGRPRSTSSTRWNCSRCTRTWRARDEEPVVIYHSHTATEAYPVADRHLLRLRAGGPLRAGLHPRGPARPGQPGVPQLPDRRRGRHRGAGGNLLRPDRVARLHYGCAGKGADDPPFPHRWREVRGGLGRHARRRPQGRRLTALRASVPVWSTTRASSTAS